ncbi:T9SS type A sorting domain-containing protein [bacterium]|nr:T9SS type A sorting domain-containing protein [bacterium]
MKSCLLILFVTTSSFAGSWTIGNSGAPGTGRCASSCHGVGTGTVVVSGFPDVYQPDSLYLIQISASGEPLKNFNASCRSGESVNPAGVLLGSSTTTIYSVPDEINGVQANALDLNSAEFYWLAPSAGIGQARLYVGAHQGGFTGANSNIALISEEALATSERPLLPSEVSLSVWPNPFNSSASISFEVNTPREADVAVYDVQGRLVKTLFSGIAQSGTNTLAWHPQTASGLYFVTIVSEGKQITQKALFAK